MLHHPVTTMAQPPATGQRRTIFPRAALSRQQAFWVVAAALGVTILGNNIPAPLYPLYQSAWHFSTGVATLIFAVVAVGVVPSLLLFGSLSDRLGRRPILLIGLALAILATVVFLFAQGVAWLLVARFLQGCAFGAVIGTATATLTELQPAQLAARALLVATAITVASQAIGPLLTGLLAQYAPWPLRLIFAVLLLLLLLALAGIWLIPETHAPTGDGERQAARFGVPRAIVMPFVLATFAVLSAFGAVGILAAMGPILAKAVLHLHAAALGGIVVFLFLGVSAIVQLLSRSLPYRVLLLIGPFVLVLGVLSLALALRQPSVPLFLGATLLAGAGQGLTYLGSQELVGSVVAPEERGGVFSVFNVVVYLGASAAALGSGFGAAALGLVMATQLVLVAVAGVAVLAGILALWTAGLQPDWFTKVQAATRHELTIERAAP